MRRSNSGQHPPQRSPAPHLSAIELIDDAPAASAAPMVRSVTAWHEQTIIDVMLGRLNRSRKLNLGLVPDQT